MVFFEDLTDVEEWLDPMGYIAFWEAIAPYRILCIADRDHCDGLISDGKVPANTILTGLADAFAIVARTNGATMAHRRKQRSSPERDAFGFRNSRTTAKRSSRDTCSVLRRATATASCAGVSVVCNR